MQSSRINNQVPNDHGLGLGDDKPRFLKKALAEMPKLYSAEQLLMIKSSMLLYMIVEWKMNLMKIVDLN